MDGKWVIEKDLGDGVCVVRLPMAAVLSRSMGLRGVWIAMCVELCVRGGLFLLRLAGKKWQKDAVAVG